MKRLDSVETEKIQLEVIECDCGFHIGLDATYLIQIGDFIIECPACGTQIYTKEVCPENEATPAESRYGREPEKVEWTCSRCGYRNAANNEVCMGAEMGDGRCGKPKPEPKSLAQYLDEYIDTEIENGNISPDVAELYAWNSWRELLEQALDAYESTEQVKIRIERV